MKEDYPLFVKWYDLMNYLIDRVEKFPRNVRFTVSDRIFNLVLDISDLIVEAIYTKERKNILKSINLNIERLRIYIRLCHDRKYISTKQLAFITENVNEVGKMVGGWNKLQ